MADPNDPRLPAGVAVLVLIAHCANHATTHPTSRSLVRSRWGSARLEGSATRCTSVRACSTSPAVSCRSAAAPSPSHMITFPMPLPRAFGSEERRDDDGGLIVPVPSLAPSIARAASATAVVTASSEQAAAVTGSQPGGELNEIVGGRRRRRLCPASRVLRARRSRGTCRRAARRVSVTSPGSPKRRQGGIACIDRGFLLSTSGSNEAPTTSRTTASSMYFTPARSCRRTPAKAMRPRLTKALGRISGPHLMRSRR